MRRWRRHDFGMRIGQSEAKHHGRRHVEQAARHRSAFPPGRKPGEKGGSGQRRDSPSPPPAQRDTSCGEPGAHGPAPSTLRGARPRSPLARGHSSRSPSPHTHGDIRAGRQLESRVRSAAPHTRDPKHPPLSRPINRVTLQAIDCHRGGTSADNTRAQNQHAERQAPSFKQISSQSWGWGMR